MDYLANYSIPPELRATAANMALKLFNISMHVEQLYTAWQKDITNSTAYMDWLDETLHQKAIEAEMTNVRLQMKLYI